MKIALLGYGTVGKGVEILAKKNNIELSYILVRNKEKVVKANMTDSIDEIVNSDVDVVVECLTGIEPAFTYASKAISNGKHVISANKKMLVKHFKELNDLASENNVSLLYSASCGGGIPWISNLNNVSNIDEILSFKGIMNGTSNYILDRLNKEDSDFNDVLKDAQDLGYAEKDPSDDIDGIDTANKTVLSAIIAFNKEFKLDDVYIKGIRNITKQDIQYFKENGYKCVLLGKGIKKEDKYKLSVLPTLFKEGTFKSISSNNNCFMLEGNDLGLQYYVGQGAGSLPTASNIIRDLNLLSNPYKAITVSKGQIDLDIEANKYYVRTSKNIDKNIIDKVISDDAYITKNISLLKLKEFVDDNDLVCEVSDD